MSAGLVLGEAPPPIRSNNPAGRSVDTRPHAAPEAASRMKFSIITPCYNSARFLAESMDSVVAQRASGVEVEHLVADGGSTDGSLDILRARAPELTWWVSEKDHGPASAINKGFARATGDIVAWINADDRYEPGAFTRVAEVFARHPEVAFVFGRCPIMDERGLEIRRGITRLKEIMFPVSCRAFHQCINYISQPTLFFRRSALEKAGPLREDWVAAWDYEFILRLWHQGRGRLVEGGPLAWFRWRHDSISGSRYEIQFREELDACIADAGPWSLQTLAHRLVRHAIIASYRRMNRAKTAS